MSENKLHDAILAATKARRAVMSENISPESVRALVADLRRGQWDNVVVQGPNPTSFSTADCPQPKQAADLIEAQERAYLALSERVGEMEKLLGELYAPALYYVTNTVTSDEQSANGAALLERIVALTQEGKR